MQVICTKCNKPYKFNSRWFKSNDPSTYICRTCKIKQTTQSEHFKNKARIKSKKILSDTGLKLIMSQKATLNNLENSEKISLSVKKYYRNKKHRERTKSIMIEKWQDKQYAQKISESIKQKWKDPTYRGKILGSRTRIKRKPISEIKYLENQNIPYILNYSLGTFTFELFIDGKYLYDKNIDKIKQLFIDHYFKNYKYINDLTEVLKLEN